MVLGPELDQLFLCRNGYCGPTRIGSTLPWRRLYCRASCRHRGVETSQWTPSGWRRGGLALLGIGCPAAIHQEKWKACPPLGRLTAGQAGSRHGPFYFSLSDRPSVVKYEQCVGNLGLHTVQNFKSIKCYIYIQFENRSNYFETSSLQSYVAHL